MAEIALSQGYSTTVDDDLADWLNQWSWYASVSQHKCGLYILARRTERAKGSRTVRFMHRDIWERLNGPIPKGMTIDHIEHGEYGALLNLGENLRLATAQGQQSNRKQITTSRFLGVHWDTRDRAWRAQINRHGDKCYLGNFNSEIDAAIAYNAAALRHYGEAAVLNRVPFVAADSA